MKHFYFLRISMFRWSLAVLFSSSMESCTIVIGGIRRIFSIGGMYLLKMPRKQTLNIYNKKSFHIGFSDWISWYIPFQWKLCIFSIFFTIVITFRLVVISDEGVKSQLTNYLNKIATMNHICNDWQWNICLYYVKQINFLNCKYINLDEVICKWYAEIFRTKKIYLYMELHLPKPYISFTFQPTDETN